MLQRFAMVLSSAGLVMTVACSQSDSGITTAVKSKLAADVIVKGSEINVDTGKNVVTLNGTVDIPAAKERAVIVARDTKGVVQVVDDIVVDRKVAATAGTVEEKAVDNADSVNGTTTDAAITYAVKTKFLADPGVSGLKINVDTDDGVVTLRGNVKSMVEANKAIAIARESSGVKSVINDLRVD
jgi:osmotically-inducible protein OsmY